MYEPDGILIQKKKTFKAPNLFVKPGRNVRIRFPVIAACSTRVAEEKPGIVPATKKYCRTRHPFLKQEMSYRFRQSSVNLSLGWGGRTSAD
jgi:hypothetical protein